MLLFYVEVGNSDAVMVLLGVLAASVKQVLGFYFGSSTGSKTKEGAMTAN